MSSGRTIPGFTERFTNALSYATRVHRTQPRKKTDIPYVGHLLGVASIVIDSRGTEDEAIAALLHDAPEDQGGLRRLEDIRAQFGPVVARVVESCSDSFIQDPEAKKEWRVRKLAYIEHLRGIDDKSVYLVSAADKLHNARSILLDLNRYGDVVWERFKGKRDGSLWYYKTLIDVYKQGPEDERRDPIVNELAQVVSKLSATRKYACPVAMAETLDPELYNLLEDVNEALFEQCGAIGRFKPDVGSDTTLWRWSLMIAALLHDVSTTASSLAFHDYRRGLIIMRRLVFEYCIRHRFYLQHPDVADQRLHDYFWKADNFFVRLGDPSADKTFLDAVHLEAQKRGKRKRDKWDNFYDIVANQNSRLADEWYARFYVFPSALMHANALCSLDLLEKVGDDSVQLHMESRQSNVSQIVYNLIWFVFGFIRTCNQTFSLGQEPLILAFDHRLAVVADRLELPREVE